MDKENESVNYPRLAGSLFSKDNGTLNLVIRQGDRDQEVYDVVDDLFENAYRYSYVHEKIPRIRIIPTNNI
ncbi:MAG: hypothetical protein ACNS60_03625 [Candidatus Cyclobacteriaceae bacterium M2_1C_046]